MGGYKTIKMDVLEKVYTDLGFEKIQTYIQSGNVIFCYLEQDVNALADKISSSIKEKLQLDITTMVFTLEEIEQIIKKGKT